MRDSIDQDMLFSQDPNPDRAEEMKEIERGKKKQLVICVLSFFVSRFIQAISTRSTKKYETIIYAIIKLKKKCLKFLHYTEM